MQGPNCVRNCMCLTVAAKPTDKISITLFTEDGTVSYSKFSSCRTNPSDCHCLQSLTQSFRKLLHITVIRPDFLPECGVGLVPKRGCLLTLAYYTFPWWMRLESDGGMILTGENRRTRRKTCPSATLSTTNPTWIDPGANPVLRGERPATNDLSHGRPRPDLLTSSLRRSGQAKITPTTAKSERHLENYNSRVRRRHSGYRACHSTQGSRVQTGPKTIYF
jgi:hypothetical protein